MSGEDMTAPMTAEKMERAEIINDKLNALSIDVKSNLNTAQQIGSIILGPELQSEGKSEKEAKPVGWLSNVIDILIFINNNNDKLKKELIRIRKEFKK